jgi:hypothetical protein
MIPNIIAEESALVLNIDNQIFDTENIFTSNIIPDKWILDNILKINTDTSKVSFLNGVNIILSPKSIVLVETANFYSKKIIVSELAANFVKFIQSKIYSIHFNPRCFISFQNSNNINIENHDFAFSTKNFLNSKILGELGTDILDCSIQLTLKNSNSPFSLKVEKVNLKMPENHVQPSILVTCSFSHLINEINFENQHHHAKNIIYSLPLDLDVFQEIVHQKILSMGYLEKH